MVLGTHSWGWGRGWGYRVGMWGEDLALGQGMGT